MFYLHLTEHERYLIDHLDAAGLSKREIGRSLKRSAGTISRELRRNKPAGQPRYRSDQAQVLSEERQSRPRRALRMAYAPLNDAVMLGLCRGHSPQQIAGRLPLDHPDTPRMRISHEAIYQWVYRQQGTTWHRQLRSKRKRRRPRNPRGRAAKQGQILNRVGIEHRPPEAAARVRLGHWEGDTLCGVPGSGGLAVHVERVSRALVAVKVEDKTADLFARRTLSAFHASGVPAGGLLTLTADNGKEFASFARIESGLGLKVYFADPHSPWQRGTNENTNGLIREFFPKGIDFRQVKKSEVARMTRRMNNRPRKCLGYRTPNEVFLLLAGVALQS